MQTNLTRDPTRAVVYGLCWLAFQSASCWVCQFHVVCHVFLALGNQHGHCFGWNMGLRNNIFENVGWWLEHFETHIVGY